jgi:hypothetical protein
LPALVAVDGGEMSKGGKVMVVVVRGGGVVVVVVSHQV